MVKQETKLGVAIILSIAAFIAILIGQTSWQTKPAVSSPPTASNEATSTPTPTATAKPTKSPKPKPVVLNYWPDGVVAEDVSNTLANSKSCTFDMCVFVKLTAVRNCSSITLDGDIYDINDELFDSFSTDYKGLKKGQSRIVELGDDAVDDSEDYIDLADATCYK